MYRLRAVQVTCSFLFCCMFPCLKHCVCISMCYLNAYKNYTLDNFFFVFKLDPFCNSCAAPDLVTQSLLLSVSSSQVMQKLALSVHSVTAETLMNQMRILAAMNNRFHRVRRSQPEANPHRSLLVMHGI